MQDQCQDSSLSLPLHIYESIFESMFSFEFHEGFLNDAWFFEYFFALQSCSRITPPLFLWLRDDPETGSLRCFLYTLCTGDVWLLYRFQYCFMLILIRFFMVAEERWIQGCFSWLDIDSISSWGACEWWSLISSIFMYPLISTLAHFSLVIQTLSFSNDHAALRLASSKRLISVLHKFLFLRLDSGTLDGCCEFRINLDLIFFMIFPYLSF